MIPASDHIDLDREFAPPATNDDLDSDWHRALANLTGDIKKWHQLSALATVILGEGGTGKTHEFRVRQASLNSQGQAAFFVPLADLVRTDLPRVLGSDWRAFQEWKGGGAEATFLLDELDEAKLAGARLDTLLRDLEFSLGDATRRARLILSCRPTEWEPKTDFLTMQSFMTRWRPESANATPVARPSTGRRRRRAVVVQSETSLSGMVEVVSIMPLDVSRACRLAERLGVTPIAEFRNAVEVQGLQNLVVRPQDVEWISAFWLGNRRLGSLRELVEADIAHKLIDRRRSTTEVKLAPDRARSGARVLAAVATFSGQRSFPVHESSVDVGAAYSIRRVLSSWRADEVADLMRLPLFDESTAGRVRIHTRAIQEYLCAEWLRTHMRKGRLSEKQICTLLFKWKTSETRVIPNHLARIGAWLAPDIVDVLTLMIKTAPEHLLDEADPAVLPNEERRHILRAFVSMYGDRDHLERHFAHSGLRRFADPSLAPDIVNYLREHPGEDVSALLLDLVSEGEIGACADIALEVALDAITSRHVRFAAVAAAAKAGTADHHTKLLHLIDAEGFDLSVAGRMIEYLFPRYLDTANLERLLLRAAPLGRWNHGTYLDNALLELPARTPEAKRLDVLRSLFSAVQAASDEWLIHPLVNFVTELLRLSPSSSSDADIARVLDYLSDDHCQYHYRASMGPLEDLMRDSVPARRGFLLARLTRQATTGNVGRHGVDIWDSPFVGNQVDVDDLQWLEAEADRLNEVSVRDAARQMRGHLLPRVVIEVPPREIEPAFEPDAVQQLREHLDDLRSGHAGWLDRCVRTFPVGDDWGGSFDFIRARDELGQEIADAILSGLRLLWRRYDVPVPRERADRSMPGEIRLGLVSLRLEIERGLDLGTLSEDEAALAARLALWELNHFPVWLEVLAGTHPAAAESEIIAEVDAELITGSGYEHVLSKVLRGPAAIRTAVTAHIEKTLLETSIPASSAAEYAFQLLFEAGELDRARWRDVLPRRLGSTKDSPVLFELWWALQLCVDPDAALDLLDSAA